MAYVEHSAWGRPDELGKNAGFLVGRGPALGHLLGKEMVRINGVILLSNLSTALSLQSCLLSSIHGGCLNPPTLSTEPKERHSQRLQNEDREKTLIFIFHIVDGDLGWRAVSLRWEGPGKEMVGAEECCGQS